MATRKSTTGSGRRYYKHPAKTHTTLRHEWEREENAHIDYHRQKLYGLCPDDYAGLLRAQDWKCALCRQAARPGPSGRTRPLSVDHDHETGQVRGLLCTRCNTRLGMLEKQGHVWVERAQEYLVLHGGIMRMKHAIELDGLRLAMFELQDAMGALHAACVSASITGSLGVLPVAEADTENPACGTVASLLPQNVASTCH
jgi:hypothetical protein